MSDDGTSREKKTHPNTKTFHNPGVQQVHGGRDLHDMLSSLYKNHLKSRRWYIYIFWHLKTVAVINSWLRHRKDCKVLRENHMLLKRFQADLAAGLILAGRGKSQRGRPSADDMPKRKKRAATVIMPVFDCQKETHVDVVRSA